MDKNTIEQLLERGLSQRQIATELGIGQTAVRYWLVKFGLKTSKKCECRKCGENDPKAFTEGRYTECRNCRGKYQTQLFRRYKLQAVEYKGGKCEICGYDKCPGAMDFHHKDPTKKDPRWRQMRTWTFSKVKKELDKCQLLCKRCHAEVHWDD